MSDEQLADLIYKMLHFDPESMTEDEHNDTSYEVEKHLPLFFEQRGDELVDADRDGILAAIGEHKRTMRVFIGGDSTVITYPYSADLDPGF